MSLHSRGCSGCWTMRASTCERDPMRPASTAVTASVKSLWDCAAIRDTASVIKIHLASSIRSRECKAGSSRVLCDPHWPRSQFAAAADPTGRRAPDPSKAVRIGARRRQTVRARRGLENVQSDQKGCDRPSCGCTIDRFRSRTMKEKNGQTAVAPIESQK